MLTAQQVVSKIETAEHIKAGAGNADGCDGVVIHPIDCRGRAFYAQVSDFIPSHDSGPEWMHAERSKRGELN